MINALKVLDARLCRGEFRGCLVRFEILSIYNSLKIGFDLAMYKLFYCESIDQISDLHSALGSLCNILTLYCFYIIMETFFPELLQTLTICINLCIQVLGFYFYFLSFLFLLMKTVFQNLIKLAFYFRKCQTSVMFYFER